MKAIVRQATYQDCLALAPRLRADDVAELAAVGAMPLSALLDAVRVSTVAWAAEYDGEVQAILGAAPLPDDSGEGAPWLLASERIGEFSTQVLRESDLYIDQMHAHFPTLRNYVHAMNRSSLMWLRWCGFKFTRVVRITPTDLFIEFEKTKPCAPPP
jgi:hypothetical protein